MKVTGPRVRGRVAGLAAALALAAGGTAAAAVGTATQVTASATHTAPYNAALAMKARASLVQYLSKNKGWNLPVPGDGPHGVSPSTINASAGAKGAGIAASFNWSGYADTTTTAGTFTKRLGQLGGACHVLLVRTAADRVLGRPRRLQQLDRRAGRHARLLLRGRAVLLHLVGDVPGGLGHGRIHGPAR